MDEQISLCNQLLGEGFDDPNCDNPYALQFNRKVKRWRILMEKGSNLTREEVSEGQQIGRVLGSLRNIAISWQEWVVFFKGGNDESA